MILTQPIINYIDSFAVTGHRVRTQNKDEFNEVTAKLPKLWQQFYQQDLDLENTDINAKVFGVYSDYESNESGFYNVTVGRSHNSGNTELHTVKIHSGNYLVFHGKGPMPQTVIEVWKSIWKYFSEDNPYQRSFVTDFEAYAHGDEVSIYIGV